MATEDCIPVQFFSATETAIYFEDAETGVDLDEDNFQKSPKPVFQNWVISKDNKFLILNVEEEFKAQNLTSEQQESRPECKFNIQIYNGGTPGRKGKAVSLSVIKDDKKMMVCCNEKHEVTPVQMDLPVRIEEDAHKALFYLKSDSSSWCYFESSLYPSEYLGFERDKDNHTLSRLVLRHKREDEVDESCQMFLK